MLISQLYRSDSLNNLGYEILQKWYKLTNTQRHAHIKWLADEMRKEGVAGKAIAVELADRLGVPIADNFPPPQPPAGRRRSRLGPKRK
jgi:hypothetical protein